jgi:hypothetical protein
VRALLTDTARAGVKPERGARTPERLQPAAFIAIAIAVNAYSGRPAGQSGK